MTRPVILVRHAMPNFDRGVSSKQWGLSDASREDCVLLAHSLPARIGRIWTSDERKARETAEVLALRLGSDVRIEPGFAEVDRPGVWDRDYREVAAGYLAGVEESGWEPPAAVVARFDAAIGRAVAADSGELLVVNHGLALSLWTSSVVSIDLVPFWRELTLPDAWRIDPARGSAERLWIGGVRGD